MQRKILTRAAMLVLAVALIIPSISGATTTATSTATSTATNIASLLSQIKTLQEQIAKLQGEIKTEVKLLRNLVRGATGDDVKELQELLAEDPEIYPEGLITGYFGLRTEAAVKRFQKKHGIDSIGSVGPKTRAKILALFSMGHFKKHKHGHDGRDGRDGDDDDKKWEKEHKKDLEDWKKWWTGTTTPWNATSTPHGKAFICHKPGGNVKQTLEIALPAVKAHLKHGDTLGACDGNGTGTTTPDTMAPSISGFIATNIGSTTASLLWSTNENADSAIWYGTTTPVVSTTSPAIASSTLTTNHLFPLSGLTASTTYYALVRSKDAAGNTATSTQISFTTLP